MSRSKQFLTALLLTAATLLAYLPAIKDGGFIWDDDHYVFENRLLAEDGGMARIWFEPLASPQYYPMVFTTFRLEYQFQRWAAGTKEGAKPRPEPFIFHLDNVLLHALSAILLWRLLRRLGVLGALLAAAIFALHPVHVESVAWVTERKNVLSGLFYLLSLGAYLRFCKLETGKLGPKRWYVLALLFFVLALFSKTVTATLGPVILVLTWWRRGRFGLRDLLLVAPFFALGLAGAATTSWVELNHVQAVGPEWDLSIAQRLIIAGRVSCFYVQKLLWPEPLIFSYERWEVDASSPWQWLFPAVVLGLLALLLLQALRGRMSRGPAAALMFFLGSLVPALGFINVYPFRYSFVADHFQYLASLGIIVPLAAFAGRIRPPRLRLGLVIVYLVLLGFLSFRQSRIYEGLESLWTDTIAKNPRSWMAYNNLGDYYLGAKGVEAAIPYFRRAAELGPNAREVLNNVGLAEGRAGRNESAIEWFDRALANDPRHHPSWANKALSLMNLGRLEEALACADKSIAVANGHARPIDYNHAHLVRGQILRAMDRTEEALAEIEYFLHRDWGNPVAHTERGLLMRKLRRDDEALRCFQFALKFDPNFGRALTEMGRLALEKRDFGTAARCYARTLAHRPENADLYNSTLGIALNALATLDPQSTVGLVSELVASAGPVAGPRLFVGIAEQLRRQKREAQHQALLGLARRQPALGRARAVADYLGRIGGN